MKNLLVFILSFTFCILGISQNTEKITLSGIVKDKASGEALYGIAVYVKDIRGLGVVTNNAGFFSLDIPQGKHTVIISSTGYKQINVEKVFQKSEKFNFSLEEESYQLDEVVVTAERLDKNVKSAQTSVISFKAKEISSVPMLFGERDLIKALQLMPGVKSAGEGSSGFHVRGGGTDQNLILLDDNTVYNPSHAMGFFSTFNSDVIKDLTIYKGNFPASYGGRISSVVDVQTENGNNNKFGVSGAIGLISSNLAIEGPIQKGKSSFLIAGRRTYADIFTNLLKEFKGNSLYFYDVNVKANYYINEENNISFSGYFGRDVMGLKDMMDTGFGNISVGLKWNTIINQKMFSSTSLGYSDYSSKMSLNPFGEGDDSRFTMLSIIQDLNLKQDFQYYLNSENKVCFGLNSIAHRLKPSSFAGSESSSNDNLMSKYSWDNAIYASHSVAVNDKINIEYGLRLSTFSIIGSGEYPIYQDGQLIENKILKKGEFGKTYFECEPRVSSSFVLAENNSIKISYNKNAQYLHLLSNSMVEAPTDQWIGSTYNIKPETVNQFSLGYFHNFFENAYEFNTEVYYKAMSNSIDYKDGANLFGNNEIEKELCFGKGRAYGIEFLFRKKTGKLSGWVSYTLSRAERKIDEINSGKWYPLKQDRTHDVSIVLMYSPTSRWNFSATWVYYTGNAVTFPSGKYQIGDETFLLYTERNGYRMPDYHRLDLGVTYNIKTKKKYQSSWNFGLYNAYGRENPYMITFKTDSLDPTRTYAEQVSLFRWVPSVSYNFKF